jgi:hypothetical protein
MKARRRDRKGRFCKQAKPLPDDLVRQLGQDRLVARGIPTERYTELWLKPDWRDRRQDKED